MKSDTPSEIIFLDVETGGLNIREDALLSIGLVRWTNGKVGDSLHIFVHPEDKQVNLSALAVNGIDLDKHLELADKRDTVIEKFKDFTKLSQKKPLMGGHNTIFDYQFLTEYGIDLRSIFQYGVIDTKSGVRALIHSGLLNVESTRLIDLCKYFKIDHTSHEALGDALSSAELYNKILSIMKRE